VAEPMAISAVSREGVEALLRRTADTLAELPKEFLTSEAEPMERSGSPASANKSFTITHDVDGAWLVQGAYIEKIVKMTQWEYYDAVMRFQRIMQALGITDALRAKGIQADDTVRIGSKELDWSD
jgi:GTP-binding protein